MSALAGLMRVPVVQAPMAGGPSTPALAAAVSEAGGLGFLAAGYKTASAMTDEITATRRLTGAPFGVNVFVPNRSPVDDGALARYLGDLRVEADALGVATGDASWNDDDWDAKLDALVRDPVEVVSFTFGCPSRDVVTALQDAGSHVVVTITAPEEAPVAVGAGADGLCLQGVEAGAHRGGLTDDDAHDGYGLLALVGAVRDATDVALVAAGAVTDGHDLAAVLAAGADAAQLGTAFLRSPESGTHPTHAAALADPAFTRTALTRAFSGRRARGLANRFMLDHPHAPSAYPQVNGATRPLRAEAARRGDAERMSLWAGQGWRRARADAAGAIVERIGAEAGTVGR